MTKEFPSRYRYRINERETHLVRKPGTRPHSRATMETSRNISVIGTLSPGLLQLTGRRRSFAEDAAENDSRTTTTGRGTIGGILLKSRENGDRQAPPAFPKDSRRELARLARHGGAKTFNLAQWQTAGWRGRTRNAETGRRKRKRRCS